MRLKWHFRNEPTTYFKEMPVFVPKSTWKPLKAHPNLEVSLSQIEKKKLLNYWKLLLAIPTFLKKSGKL